MYQATTATNRKRGLKAVAILSLLPMAFGLAGCSGSSSSDGTSKQEVEQGLVKLLDRSKGQLGLNDEQVKNISSCVAEKLDDKISEESKQKLAAGKDIMPDSPDHEAVFEASSSCAKEEVLKSK
ncbi:hypothetical protein BSR28_08350 [Boudabousia liubingyangii]|uniref:hypothetical protein n=1 Tax=Boudabousia liubingyangii TaxID=1921764 RepID=UPI0009388AA9|nr:hypothetical protein [Boudabousia liubingyangii]OKL46066.1 hypothetical protein BSR28_08350 [Boudabousia liubingyangii]